MTDNIAIIADMVREAEKHADDLSKDRIRAVEYYQGIMRDTPSDVGRSQMVKRTVRAQIKKVLPSMMRTIFGSDTIVEFQPVGPQDEEASEQASKCFATYCGHPPKAPPGAPKRRRSSCGC